MNMNMYGKWRVVKKLGKGGQGIAYLATDTSKLDLEAIKRALAEASPTLPQFMPRKKGWKPPRGW
jgi:hypothetical protein